MTPLKMGMFFLRKLVFTDNKHLYSSNTNKSLMWNFQESSLQGRECTLLFLLLSLVLASEKATPRFHLHKKEINICLA